MDKITKYAQSFGITVGWDLSHAIGNIPLYMNKWNVDFATYCSYKFLNGGPHSSGGLYVH
jgi:kynureninase